MALYRDERIEWRGRDVVVTLHAVYTSENIDAWNLQNVIVPSYYDAAKRYTGEFYRDNGSETINRRRTISRETKQPMPEVGVSIVRLGGPFEEIGEQHEAIGGDNQKVG